MNLASSVGLLDECKLFVKGFSDSLDIFKYLLPDRLKAGKSFSLGSLAQDLLKLEDIKEAHEAMKNFSKLYAKIRQLFLSTLNASILKKRLKKKKKVKKI